MTMNTADFTPYLTRLESYLEKHPLPTAHASLVLRRCLRESWFLDTLWWLLDPKGSHGYGVRFLQEFLEAVAQKRSRPGEGYSRNESMLKWGKAGRGQSVGRLNLGNAAVLREFYLSQPRGRRSKRGPRYLDIAVLDLDSDDALFMAVEGKLFLANRPGQLQEYEEAVEEKYSRAKLREYVYLTIFGDRPIVFDQENAASYAPWVSLGWAAEILDILNRMKGSDQQVEVRHFREILEWLREMRLGDLEADVSGLHTAFLKATTDCLLEELQRLAKTTSGRWRVLSTNEFVLEHTRTPARRLYIDLLPSMSITVQGRQHGRGLFEKILVPFGCSAEQVFNLLDVAARDIYWLFFDDPMYYLKNVRRKSTLTVLRTQTKPLFSFVYEHKEPLAVLFGQLEAAKKAQRSQAEAERLAVAENEQPS